MSDLVAGQKDDDLGYTNVIIQSDKGRSIFSCINDRYVAFAVDADKAIALDGVMVEKSATAHQGRGLFYKDIDDHDLNTHIKKHVGITAIDYLLENSKFWIYKLGFIGVLRSMKKRLLSLLKVGKTQKRIAGDRVLVLSNALADATDEGCLKLTSAVVKKIKEMGVSSLVVSFERLSSKSDIHIDMNKFHINAKLISLIRKTKQKVLYIPFPAPTFYMALRIWLLSRFTKYGLSVIMVRQYHMKKISKWLLCKSKAELIVFSEDAKEFYAPIVKDRVEYVKLGVDTKKFVPVSPEDVIKLKEKYGFDTNKPIVFHAGHMKVGRNIAQLMKVSEKYQVLLVISTLSKERQSEELRKQLESCKNIRIIDDYVENIEELFQLSDVYFFPVKQMGNCIDVPLSCLEAASCNKPVITTDYGEMEKFVNKEGFYHLTDFSPKNINRLIDKALSAKNCNTRSYVLEYDWDNGVKTLLNGSGS